MIYEVRIFTQIGSSIYAAEMEIVNGRIVTQPIESPSLFSSMMSAILSFDAEIRNSQVQEFIYKDNKAVLHFLDEIAFLIYADTKVPNHDLQLFLRELAHRWLKNFEDREYIFLSSAQMRLISKMVDDTVSEVFWWIESLPTPRNLVHIGYNTLINPNSTYYFRYLSNYYHILSILPPLLVIFLAQQFGVVISGFSPKQLTNPTLLTVGIPIIVLWIGPGLFLKALFGQPFHLRGYYTISGLMSLYLIPMIILSSSSYSQAIVVISSNFGIFQEFGRIFLLLAPVNLTFFGFFLMTGFATSFANEVKQERFFIAYALTMTFLISLTSTILV